MAILPLNIPVLQKPIPYLPTIGFSAAGLLIFLAIIFGKEPTGSPVTFTETPFSFGVYCPVSTKDNLAQYSSLLTNAQIGQIGSLNIQDDIYVVYIQARPTNITPASPAGLYYCGLARTWLGSCADAQVVCSSPGPMFYMRANSPAYIVWVNNINTAYLNWTEEDCYSPTSDNNFCTIESRLPPSYTEKPGCAYKDPTNLGYKSSSMRIDRMHVPISPHIHGLSTRPTFDGNPLSWFDSNGNYGVGFNSLENTEYYSQFETSQPFYSMPQQLGNKKLKINYAPNAQPAGNLFYHDHPMRSTKYNVKSGLAGLYIIYDDKVESQMPPKDHEKFILFSANIGDARSTLAPQTAPTTPSSMPGMNMNVRASIANILTSHLVHSEKIYTLNSSQIYERNNPYRFRVLNSHFDNIYTDISFSVYYKETLGANGQKIITEIDPTNITYDLSANQHRVTFTMIGADSTLFDKFIPNQDRFDLGAAERIQMLVTFNQASGIPKEVQYFYLTCNDGNIGGTVVKYRFQLVKVPDVPRTATLPMSLNQPFTNLSSISSSAIAVKRMRPLLSLPRDGKFVINGHYMFDMGASDNPKIGTTEDWFMINTLVEAHPIHFHLVNFQLVQTYSLRMVQDGCSQYQVDFLRTSGFSKFASLTDAQLCDYISNGITSSEAEMVFHGFNSLYLENQTINTPNGKISGFNVLELVNPTKNTVDPNCPLSNIYKYLCEETTSSIPQHYRRWKDTALIHPYSVSVLRIRWAMTEYDEKVQAYPYFKIPEDQLMEFPGFVYHCHILPHEDNEMMRPFLMQPSDAYLNSLAGKLKAQGTTYDQSSLAYSWSDKQLKINKKLGCNSYA